MREAARLIAQLHRLPWFFTVISRWCHSVHRNNPPIHPSPSTFREGPNISDWKSRFDWLVNISRPVSKNSNEDSGLRCMAASFGEWVQDLDYLPLEVKALDSFETSGSTYPSTQCHPRGSDITKKISRNKNIKAATYSEGRPCRQLEETADLIIAHAQYWQKNGT